MPLLYISRYIISSYAFKRTSAPSSGVSYLTVRFSAHQLAVNTWPDVLVNHVLLTDAEDLTVKYETSEYGSDVRRQA